MGYKILIITKHDSRKKSDKNDNFLFLILSNLLKDRNNLS